MPEDDAPKSAWQLALEKLKKQDEAEGRTASPLTAGQKERIATIRQEYEAKTAELEILHQSRLRTAYAAEDAAEAVAKAEEGYQRDRRRLEEDRESKIARVRDERGS